MNIQKSLHRSIYILLGKDSIHLVLNIYHVNPYGDMCQYLEDHLDDFEILKLEVRLCAALKVISIKHLADLSKMLDLMGN